VLPDFGGIRSDERHVAEEALRVRGAGLGPLGASSAVNPAAGEEMPEMSVNSHFTKRLFI